MHEVHTVHEVHSGAQGAQGAQGALIPKLLRILHILWSHADCRCRTIQPRSSPRTRRRATLRAVFGVADERAGEVPAAAVQLASDADTTREELQHLVSEKLAGYKRLHHVVFVDVVPRTPSGKVLRRNLRDEWAPRLAPASTGTN